MKQQRRATAKQTEAPTPEMYRECQELLQMFGLPYIIAPQEAEAQCAFLNEHGVRLVSCFFIVFVFEDFFDIVYPRLNL